MQKQWSNGEFFNCLVITLANENITFPLIIAQVFNYQEIPHNIVNNIKFFSNLLVKTYFFYFLFNRKGSNVYFLVFQILKKFS